MARDLAPDELREKTRNQIIARVGSGESKITPEQAEEEAKATGVGPLAYYPPKDRFNPFQEPDWSLPMAAMWIIYRTADAVRQAWPLYRSGIRHWRDGALHPPLNIEFKLWDVISTTADSDAPPWIMPGLEAQEDLWKRLHNGKLFATGIPAGKTESIVIGGSEWSLEPIHDPLSYFYYVDGPADAIGGQFDVSPRYTRVQVRRDAVLRIWRRDGTSEIISDPLTMNDKNQASPEATEEEVKTWLDAYIAKGGTIISGPDLYKKFESEIGKTYPRDAFPVLVKSKKLNRPRGRPKKE